MNVNLRIITNSFRDVQLVSLSSWRQANQIEPRDRGGPYVVLQEGYDPTDTKMVGREFILGRSGKWLALEHFYKLPVPERRDEFVFGRAADVMVMMEGLPSKVQMLSAPESDANAPASPQQDELASAIQVGKKKQAGGSSGSPG